MSKHTIIPVHIRTPRSTWGLHCADIAIIDEQRERLAASLAPDDTFIPAQLGLPHLGEQQFRRASPTRATTAGSCSTWTASSWRPAASRQHTPIGRVTAFVASM